MTLTALTQALIRDPDLLETLVVEAQPAPKVNEALTLSYSKGETRSQRSEVLNSIGIVVSSFCQPKNANKSKQSILRASQIQLARAIAIALLNRNPHNTLCKLYHSFILPYSPTETLSHTLHPRPGDLG